MKIAGSQWFACPNEVFEKRLTEHQLIVLVYLFRRAGTDGASWPAQGTIARACGISARTVQRALTVLLRKKLLRQTHRREDGRGQTTNIYQLTSGLSVVPVRQSDVGGTSHRRGPHVPVTDEVLLSEVPLTEVPTTGDADWIQYTAQGFSVPFQLRQRWINAYPALQLDQEIQRAYNWAMANPKNRKKNWHRFLVNWLARAQEKAPRVVTDSPLSPPRFDGPVVPSAAETHVMLQKIRGVMRDI